MFTRCLHDISEYYNKLFITKDPGRHIPTGSFDSISLEKVLPQDPFCTSDCRLTLIVPVHVIPTDIDLHMISSTLISSTRFRYSS